MNNNHNFLFCVNPIQIGGLEGKDGGTKCQN